MSDAAHLPSELTTAARLGARAVKAAVVQLGGAPLSDGSLTTCLYHGEADGVGLVHWMDVFPLIPPFSRLRDTDLWWLTLALPAEARIEYRIRVVRNDRRRDVLDAFNPERATNPFGANSIVAGPGYERPEWTLPDAAVPAGTFIPIEVGDSTFGEPRPVRLYQPAGGVDERTPLVIAHDGSDYVEHGALTTVVDNLVGTGAIPPIALALTDPGERNVEYTGHQVHADFVVKDLLPAVEAHLRPSRRIIMGASLGAVASLHSAWSHPGVFDAAILQSGSFATGLGGRFRRGSVFKPVIEFLGAFHNDPRTVPPSVYASCGRFEGMLSENEVLVAQLRRLDVDVEFEVTPDGHDWGSWRNRLRSAFQHTVGNAPPPSM